MSLHPRQLRDTLRRLVRDDSGLAFIEFAFIAPIFLVLVLAGLEISNLAIAHLRVSQIAMTVADNAGRVDAGIDEANIHEVFAGAQIVGKSLDFEDHGRVVLSSLEQNGRTGGNRGQMIRWQRCWGALEVDPAYGVEGDGEDDDSLEDGLGADGNKVTASANVAMMFVEATYEYQPLVATDFFEPQTIRYESAFNVRARQNNVLSNTQGLAEMEC
ncbi:pilus assembly protein [Altererythrobacter arenosus]|uniref:Pilus assembly protein n=1 Tax=Altererythrobacter arenosus TaxID=3032592 RepID=A0ABY8FPC6_9SPHN|nr:TadE/TadG family type IV pilus assembly protein [Altererythrobacter sp. CAU 1644]WFL76642.1 pilus assembly protein [Altererythrobacter sp. CAU 1644]